MKKLWLVLFFACMLFTVHAQYKTYKKQYDVKDYKYQKTDRYSPTAASLLGIIPGLGHCYVGEPLRGFAFFGLSYGSTILTIYGVSQAYQHSANKDRVGLLVGGGTVMFVGSYIWSIADVTKVSKIKNMAFRDSKSTVYFYPSIQSSAIENTRMAFLPGVTLTINF